MYTSSSDLTGEEFVPRCNRDETGVSHEALNFEGLKAAISANGAEEEERQLPASPSQSPEQESPNPKPTRWKIEDGVVWIEPVEPDQAEIEEQREHKQQNLDQYLILLLGDESRVC